MKYRIHFDCIHCGKPHKANSKKELIAIIIKELSRSNFVGFACSRGTGLYGCNHKFSDKVIIIKPLPGEAQKERRKG